MIKHILGPNSWWKKSHKMLDNDDDDHPHWFLLASPTKARILCSYRFIIEYNSWRDFGPLGNNNNNNNNKSIYFFILGYIWKMIFWVVLKLEISYYRVIIIISWRIFVSFRGDFFFLKIIFLHGEIFECFHNSSSFALKDTLKCKWQGHSVIDTLLCFVLLFRGGG
jgi:hypothetical protein